MTTNLCALCGLLALSIPVAAQEPADGEGRFVSYDRQETLVDPDSFIQFLLSPTFHRGEEELRASWAVVWLSRQQIGRLAEGDDAVGVAGDLPVASPEGVEGADAAGESEETLLPNFFQEFAQSRFSGLAREMYLEGPVEIFVRGERIMLADAVYVDLIDGHGWIANVTASANRQIGKRVEKLQVRADWMRHSADGSLRADSAIVTTGDFEDSSLSISTGDLRIRPTRSGEAGAWEFKLKENRVHLLAGIWIPLPPLTFNTEQSGKPILETFGFGDSARVGSFIQATFNREMGGAGRTLNDIFAGDPKNYSAHYGLRASWLGSRGVLTDASIDIESEEHYWLKFHYGLVYDDNDDKGIVRVPLADRDRWRRWARARGRYFMSDEEWVQVRFSHESDPGVQSEFYEREFLRYEQRHNDVVWRRADEQDYFSASLRLRANDFRTEVLELPEVRFQTGATDIAQVLGRPLLYRADATAGVLRRREGDPAFDLLFPDGLGDRDVTRIGTQQRLSLPFRTGLAGLRAVPFVEGLAVGWDRDDQDVEEAARAAIVGGLGLSTHMWRPVGDGGTLQLSPFASWHTDIASADTASVPVRFDALEDPLEGTFGVLGMRAIWESSDASDWVDVHLRARHVENQPGGSDGWRPIETLIGLRTAVGDVPVGFFHDGSHSLEGDGTLYSLTDIGALLTPDLAVEVSHRRSRDELLGAAIFETAAIGSRYRWTEKWELEGRHEISLFNNDRLEDIFLIRRFGYDLVTDITLSFRAGEGTSFGFRIEPTITYSGSRLGVVRTVDY